MITSKRISTLLYMSTIFLILIISFRSFAPFLDPNLNSDNAIHILMAYDLKLPDDFYYWGQDRLGSLVPILGHLLLQVSSLRPVESVSYVNYLLLIIGFLSFASLFQSTLTKVIFALVWFLPIPFFSALISIAQPYGPQLSSIGLAIVLLNYRIKNAATLTGIKRHGSLSGAIALLFIALWMSDFTLITLLVFAGMGLWHLYSILRQADWTSRSWRSQTLLPTMLNSVNIGVISVLGFQFVHYAKDQASIETNYTEFNTLEQVLVVLQRLLTSLGMTLSFQTPSFRSEFRSTMMGIHASLAIFLILSALVIAVLAYQNHRLKLTRWFYLFLVNGILSFGALILLQWVYVNGSLRYYSTVYVSGWIAMLLFLEGLNWEGLTWRRVKQIGVVLTLVTVLAGSLALPRYVFAFEKATPTVDALHDIQSLGNTGLIGDYWTSYLLCTVNPSLLNCTPYDRRASGPCLPPSERQEVIGRVRCTRCVPRVFEADSIYLIKEKWLDEFPPDTQQFGHCLLRSGDPIQIGGYTLAPYNLRAERQ